MAINFPSTSGQATDGSFTHTASGITWAWDGTTWKATGVTSSYTLPTAAANVKGGIKIGNGLTMTGETLAADASAITVQEEGSSLATAATTLNFTGAGATASGTGAVKTINIPGATSGVTVQEEGNSLATAGTTLNFVGSNVTATGTGATKTITITSSSGLQSRTTATGSTGSIAANASAGITIAVAKTYVLHKIQTDAAAWVVVYTDTTSRTNDASRTELEDPVAGAGVIAEVVTVGAVTQMLTPGTIGFNNDGTPSTDAYLKVVNKSGGTNTINVTLHFLQLEA